MTVSEPGTIVNERALARDASRGQRRALAELIRRHWGRVFVLHRLATGDAQAAQALTGYTFEVTPKYLDDFLRDDEPLPRWMAALTRDAARRHLREDDWKHTAWAQGREIFSDPPEVQPLSHEALHEGAKISAQAMDESLDRLSLGHQLFARLLFREGIPAGRLAGMLGISSTFVSSFVYGILDQLGSLEGVEHQDGDCPASLTLANQVLPILQDPVALKEKMLEHQGCPGCKDILFRCIRLFHALREHGPKGPEAPDDLVEDLATASLEAPAPEWPEGQPPPAKLVPLRTRPDLHRRRQDRVVHFGLGTLIFLVFGAGLYLFLGRNPLRAFRFESLESEPPPALVQTQIGTYVTARGRIRPLLPGVRLDAPRGAPISIQIHEGPRIALSPQSAFRGFASSLEVQVGRAVFTMPRNKPWTKVIRAGMHQVRANQGMLGVSTHPDGALEVSTKGGGAEITLSTGKVVSLESHQTFFYEPGKEQITKDLIRGAFSEAVPARYASKPLGDPQAGSGGQTAATPFEAWKNSPGSGSGRIDRSQFSRSAVPNPQAPPPPRVLGGGSPGKVRGIRDAF